MLDRDLIEDLLLEYIEEYGMLKKFPIKNDKTHYLIYCNNNSIVIVFCCVEINTVNNLGKIFYMIQKLTKRIKFFDESLNISYKNYFSSSYVDDHIKKIFNFEITIK